MSEQDGQDETLVGRRSRRSTAGNRMQTALAEMALEDLKEAEDDVDFANVVDEEDIFESDFESTDEEAAQEDEDKAVRDEENQAKKAARAKVAKATALAHDRHKVSFNPQAQAQAKATSSQHPEASGSGSVMGSKTKRRVSLGLVVNAETGEVLEGVKSKRQSQRKHTIMNTSETVSRMKKSEEKRAAATPKKIKSESRVLTQDELISRALDNEEGNIVEHRDYLRLEEEKRKRARVVRSTVDGPLLTWISKAEEVKIAVDPPAPPPVQTFQFTYGNQPLAMTNQTPYLYAASVPYSLQTTPGTTQTMPQLVQPPGPTPIPYTPPQPPAPPVERTEKVAKNYVVHELGQFETVPKPAWKDTMEAMFGDHVQWEDLRVYVGKGRPLSRPKQTCPITGRPASYRDPRTGVPFANVHAYETITRIVAHEYIWSDSLGCYVSRQNGEKREGAAEKAAAASGVATGVPEGSNDDKMEVL